MPFIKIKDKDGKEKEVYTEDTGLSAETTYGAKVGAGIGAGIGAAPGTLLSIAAPWMAPLGVPAGALGAGVLGGVGAGIGSAIGSWSDGYKYNNWFGMTAGNEGQLKQLIELYNKLGYIPSDSEIANELGDIGTIAIKNLKSDLKTFLDKNEIKYNTKDQYDKLKASDTEETTSDTTDIVDELLMTSPYGERANQYRNAMYNSISQYEQDVNASLASAELDAYRLLGQQQLELENQIASQRMQAIKSGVTSAQLASQELANMFAAQSAASSIAQQTMSNRAQQYNTIAQQRASVEPDLYNMINSNQATGANVYAQLYAAQQSYNSYMNQPYANFKAYLDAFGEDPKAIETYLGK